MVKFFDVFIHLLITQSENIFFSNSVQFDETYQIYILRGMTCDFLSWSFMLELKIRKYQNKGMFVTTDSIYSISII